MNHDVIVLSQRRLNLSPAMCCVVELEDCAVSALEAELVLLPEMPRGNLAGRLVYVPVLNAEALLVWGPFLGRLRQRGAKVIAHIFDSWNADTVFYRKARRIASLVDRARLLRNQFDRIVVPFARCVDRFHAEDRHLVRNVPFGIDSTRAEGLNAVRPIAVLGYGRQQEAISRILEESLNQPATTSIYHWTGHMAIGQINDFAAHRRFFWKIAQSSQVALAFDPAQTHPHRFPDSVVGQRWVESLAAGCVVMGWRPATPEADAILDWEDATIEVSRDPREAVDHILDMVAQPALLQRIREDNVAQIRSRHDWRHRFDGIFGAL